MNSKSSRLSSIFDGNYRVVTVEFKDPLNDDNPPWIQQG